jgi:predicted ester cyclase
MSVEENKALAHRFYEGFVNPGNLEVADEIIAPEGRLYFGGKLMGTGPEAFKRTLRMLRGGFPDMSWTIEELVADEDAVAARLTGRGTHQGEFMGVASTGKRVEIQSIAILHFAAGKIVEDRGMPDMPGLLQQVSAVPVPESAGAQV